ncbi:MAG: ATPase [Nitrospira sp.]|nr:MAG: ATPase [Nitrospira sp.]
MNKNLIARSTIDIDAPTEKVWHALVSPDAIKQYMFGTTVVSAWREGTPIVWKGEWQGKSYEDKGTILQLQPQRTLQYTHFSSLSGLPDVPDNHHTVTIELSPSEGLTRISLTQDNNRNEEARAHSEKNWGMMLVRLKQFLER